VRKIQRCERALGSELHSRLAPVQAPGNHQVQHQLEILLHAEGDALADAPKPLHGLALHSLEGRLGGAQKEGARDADTFERLVEDAPLEGFNVNDDVGKFRHGSAILSWGFATVNPFVDRQAGEKSWFLLLKVWGAWAVARRPRAVKRRRNPIRHAHVAWRAARLYNCGSPRGG